jgi:hypothetical protein
MACGCIKRQKWLVEKLCKNGLTALCKRAMARLAQMEAKENEQSV